jgi:hypothetical protein
MYAYPVNSTRHLLSFPEHFNDSKNVSSGMSSRPLPAPLRGRKYLILWRRASSVVGSARDQTFCGEAPAFLSESIMREIITGRYLEPRIRNQKKVSAKHVAYTRMPLIVAAETVVRIAVRGADRWLLTQQEEVGLIPRKRHSPQCGDEKVRTYPSEIQCKLKHKVRGKYH